jgi:uncharacterized repeat protein (TIGR01451 family)
LTAGTFTAGANTNVGGDWTNYGATFTHSSGTVTFNGSSAANINGSATTAFYNLTINKGAASTTVTSSGNAFSTGNNLTVTQGNLILQSTDANYMVTNDLIVSTNGTLTHSVNWDTTNKLLRVDGNLSIDGTYAYPVARSHLQMGGANKTIRTGSSALSILTLVHTSGAITASGTVTVNDNFWASFDTAGGTFATSTYTVNANKGLYNAGGTVNINGGTLNVTSGFLTGGSATNGNVTFSSGTLNTDSLTIGDGTRTSTFSQSGGTANIGNLTLSGAGNSYTCTNSPAINISGNWTNNGGTFTPASSTVTFNGASAQALGGSSGTTFYNLAINKSSGDVTLGANETVSNTLALTSGKAATTASYYLAVTNTSSSAVTGYGYSSYVNGSLRRSLATGSSYLFPVGDASNYRPFELNSITCSSPVVQVTMSSTGASTVDSTLSSVAARNWYAQLISGSFTSATVRITENGMGSTSVVASSPAQSGNYTNRGGNSIGTTITSNTGISYTSSAYFAIGQLALPNLTIVKSTSKTSVAPGDIVIFTAVVTNTGGGIANNVVIHDPVPANTTYVANSTTLNGRTVYGDGATLPLIAGLLVDDNGSRTPGAAATGILPAGKSATITFQVTVN